MRVARELETICDRVEPRGWGDLAIEADVLARHVSFLETGRAHPSEPMLMRLATALGLSLREQDTVLRAAGYDARFAEPAIFEDMPQPLHHALDRMLAQHFAAP